MNPLLKYTLGRLGLFLAAFLIVYPVPQLSLPVKLLAALIASFVLSWFLLRRWRDEMSVHLADKLAKRRAEKARLRAALSGEDDAAADPGPHSESADPR